MSKFNPFENVDIIIEDEGDFFTVNFQSDKAKEIVKADVELSKVVTTLSDYLSIAIDKESKLNLIGWAMIHKLTTNNLIKLK
jgi:hypothetical protein